MIKYISEKVDQKKKVGGIEMEFNKCSRCGNFYVAEGNVCPKCFTKDHLEFSTFQTYVKENGLLENLDTISTETGISVKNLNRFIEYDGFNHFCDHLGNVTNSHHHSEMNFN